MKTLLITFALLTALLPHALAGKPVSDTTVSDTVSTKPEPASCALTVVFTNVTHRTGKIYIGIANDQTSFSGGSYRKTRIQVPSTGDVRFTFEGLPAGHYAVRVFQDLNDNQQLDRTGPIPVEPFGFSISTKIMGLPTFEQCGFDLTQNKQIDIQLTQF